MKKKKRPNPFGPKHGKRLLKAIEIAHKEKHISESDYRSLKSGVEKSIKEGK
jgi:hypothetical protein